MEYSGIKTTTWKILFRTSHRIWINLASTTPSKYPSSPAYFFGSQHQGPISPCFYSQLPCFLLQKKNGIHQTSHQTINPKLKNLRVPGLILQLLCILLSSKRLQNHIFQPGAAVWEGPRLTSRERNAIRRCPFGDSNLAEFRLKKHDCRLGGFCVIFVYLGLDSFYAPIMTMKGEVGFLQWTWNGLLHCREKHNCIVIFTRIHENL